ncbi:hypothetical protein L226DRAFT_614136 [Lentinus tigrinus ALCF2SS1-7]|uniref:Uncharacterized protein n=1 Tax=Lentinus tigrinus ALCF2SS1-6 TaxID=1328759 RepID=A0A5C2S7W5_9APHY|nr:hypothetical protein L227DRAFT_654303 [Lentinus tigrinus ALCF2SS1-6]RPD73643.1 hypothetical protein L226DRAFT_614136 [Lentinus tigrinus ALCF2SS1-7]
MSDLEPSYSLESSYSTYLATDSTSTIPMLDIQLSADDQAVMRLLSPEALAGWTSARIEENMPVDRIRTLKSLKNSLALINRKLPPEILMEIFVHITSHSIPICGSPARWFVILHVCRLWRSLVFRTPACWAAVAEAELWNGFQVIRRDSSISRRAKLFLTLSRQTPLTLTLGGLPAHVSQIVTPHINHISYLALRVREHKELALLLSAGMPLLQELRVAHYYVNKHDHYQEVLVTDVTRLPRLRSLWFPASFISLSGLARLAGQLKQLVACTCECASCMANPPTLQGLLDVLKDCSSLEGLIMEDVLYGQPSATWDRPLSLPALRELEMLRNFLSSLAAILPHFAIPKYCKVCLIDSGAPCLREVLPEDIHSFHPIALADTVEFQFYEHDGATVKTYGGGFNFLHTIVYNVDAAAAFTFFSGISPPLNNITKLILRTPPSLMDVTDVDKAALRTLLDSLPLIYHLDATSYNGHSDYLSLLGETSSAGGCLCPRLEDLTVRFQWRFFPLQWYADKDIQLPYDSEEPPRPPSRTGPEALKILCDGAVQVLEQRGHAVSLKTLRIAVYSEAYEKHISEMERWNESTRGETERLQMRVGHVVDNIAVEYAGEYFFTGISRSMRI